MGGGSCFHCDAHFARRCGLQAIEVGAEDPWYTDTVHTEQVTHAPGHVDWALSAFTSRAVQETTCRGTTCRGFPRVAAVGCVAREHADKAFRAQLAGCLSGARRFGRHERVALAGSHPTGDVTRDEPCPRVMGGAVLNSVVGAARKVESMSRLVAAAVGKLAKCRMRLGVRENGSITKTRLVRDVGPDGLRFLSSMCAHHDSHRRQWPLSAQQGCCLGTLVVPW